MRLICSSCGEPFTAPHKFSCYVRGRYVDADASNTYEDVPSVDDYEPGDCE